MPVTNALPANERAESLTLHWQIQQHSNSILFLAEELQSLKAQLHRQEDEIDAFRCQLEELQLQRSANENHSTESSLSRCQNENVSIDLNKPLDDNLPPDL